MAILSGIPVLNCRAIEVTLDFYQQLLQFVVVNKRESNKELKWVHLMHGDTTLMLQAIEQQSGETIPFQQSSLSLYFFINNIKELHHFIKAKNHKVSEIITTDYQMLEFSVSDPEGNIITLGQAIDKQQS
jgi:catechol-2,3-dioxygenase